MIQAGNITYGDVDLGVAERTIHEAIDLGINAAGEPLRRSWKETFLLRKLPYVIVLALTLLGVAYTSMSHQPIDGYWEFLALATGVVCVATGWPDVYDRQARFRLVWMQAAHWSAILVAMNIVLLPGVQRMLTAPATGLTLLSLR
jgi:hypothetical protein